MRYAEKTSVSVERSKAEIERTLQRYGADEFMAAWSADGRARIGFRLRGLLIQIDLVLPGKNDPRFSTTPTGRRRRDSRAAEQAWEQACRSSWRALSLVVKAKLEAVEAGISTMEHEFLAWVALPDGRTIGSVLLPQIEGVASSGRIPRLLPGPSKPGVP